MSTTQPKSHPPGRETCAWKCCSYPNGLILIVIAQIILLLACLLSVGSAAQCSFVKANLNTTEVLTTDHDEITPNPEVQRGLGFFFFEADDGECHWDYKDEYEFENYIDLTSGWKGARRSAAMAVVFGWVLFLYSLFFSCVSHPRIFRFIFGGLILFVATLQASSFGVFDSSFCDDFACEYNKGAGGQSVSATILFAVSGVLFFFTKKYSPDAVATPVTVNKNRGDIENQDGTEGTCVQKPVVVQARIVSPIPNDGIADAQEVEVPDEAKFDVDPKKATLY